MGSFLPFQYTILIIKDQQRKMYGNAPRKQNWVSATKLAIHTYIFVTALSILQNGLKCIKIKSLDTQFLKLTTAGLP